jgi:hypothetical protein
LGIVEASYDVRFPLVGKPTMETPQNPRLSDRQLARFKALAIAQDRLGEGRFPLCKGNYNFVVLDDPAGSGFLVYFLHATNVAGEVPVGGHYRISVSGDGAAVTQVDRLSVTCLTVRKDSNIPKGGKIVAAVVSHLVSDTPIETHVFLSLQEHMPFAVVTGNQRFWVVEEGRISPMAIPPDRPGINPAAK